MSTATDPKFRLKLVIRGLVQGVGFRPFIYNLAKSHNLNGWVNNTSQGVFIEVEGTKETLEKFLLSIEKDKPSLAIIQSMESSYLPCLNYEDFKIITSVDSGEKSTLILPDIATCKDCLNDIFSAQNRRYLYPFTNCTNCGPRYSIIEKLPYDRTNTSMKIFTMCKDCQDEYNTPENRRFHAQPNACPNCGPKLELYDIRKTLIASSNEAMNKSLELLSEGKVIAIKGIGGYQLIADASNPKAIQKLRKRKNREEKPFALMAPNIEWVKNNCKLSKREERLLKAPEAPIVLLKKSEGKNAFKEIAPENPYLGVMLPYSPLHHILLKEFSKAIIATSGNLSDEPICITEKEAFTRLEGIADFILSNNRPIVRQVDDSIARIINGQEMILRRARGFAPLPIFLKNKYKATLSTGAHLKNSFALLSENKLIVSQHIGDLDSEETINAFNREIKSLPALYDFIPEKIACDKHPDYVSSIWAMDTVNSKNNPVTYSNDHRKKNQKQISKTLNISLVQHHLAHVFSCMAENELNPPLLGIAWDGTGLGNDKAIWGGEFFHITSSSHKHLAQFRYFKLPGGDKAIKEPYRVAIALLSQLSSSPEEEFKDLAPLKTAGLKKLSTLKQMMNKNVNSPLCSSAGRLFDALSSLLNIKHFNKFEGQGAMSIEFLLEDIIEQEYYAPPIKREELKDIYKLPLIANNAVENKSNLTANNTAIWEIDWRPMFREIIKDIRSNKENSLIALKFHNSLSEAIVEVAKKANEKNIALSGGCFQNKYLLERTISRLREENYNVFWHQRLPTGDGGLSAGQALYVATQDKMKGN